jgi:hypothetical protein
MPVMSRPTMRACMVSVPSKGVDGLQAGHGPDHAVVQQDAVAAEHGQRPPPLVRRHPRHPEPPATSRSLVPASISSAAASRTRSRRACSAPVSPPPSGVPHGSGIARSRATAFLNLAAEDSSLSRT